MFQHRAFFRSSAVVAMMTGITAVVLLLSAARSRSSASFAQSTNVPPHRVPIGGIVYNYVGHVYINPATGMGEVAGYFASIAGIENSFKGAASEATAFFTYRSDPLTFTALPADVDTAITILNAGKWHIYFNPNPAGNWADPSSFSQGQLVADLNHNALLLVSNVPAGTHQAVFAGELLASYDFVYAGRKLNFADFFPDGITNFSSATNTLVTGGALGFPVVFADAGWAVAKGHTDATSAEDAQRSQP